MGLIRVFVGVFFVKIEYLLVQHILQNSYFTHPGSLRVAVTIGVASFMKSSAEPSLTLSPASTIIGFDVIYFFGFSICLNLINASPPLERISSPPDTETLSTWESAVKNLVS